MNLLLEQVNQELLIREPSSSPKTVEQARATLARATSAIETNYSELTEEVREKIYLCFLDTEEERRRWEVAKPDCYICENWHEFLSEEFTFGCQADKKLYEIVQSEKLPLCTAYFPTSQAAVEESRARREQKLQVVRDFIKELEQKEYTSPPCMPGAA